MFDTILQTSINNGFHGNYSMLSQQFRNYDSVEFFQNFSLILNKEESP